MAISGFPIAATATAASVGDLTQLSTTNKTDLVSAIIELEQTKADQEEVGDVDSLDLVQIYQNT